MFDELVAGTAGTHGARAVDAWTRVESAATARRLTAMVTMLDAAYATSGSAQRDQWCIDNWSAVCHHIGAAQRITHGAASGFLLVGTALRDRFPHIRAVFHDGLISYPLVRTIVYRALNVTDPEALRALDQALALALRTWEPQSQDLTEKAVDAFVEKVDPRAVRRTQLSARTRSLDITIDDATGIATLFGTMFAHDAAAFDARLDAFADTVCPADPRTKDQRRADAPGAMALGADRLTCLCNTGNCSAAQNPPAAGVVVYVIAHTDTVTEPTPAPSDRHDPTPPLDEDEDLVVDTEPDAPHCDDEIDEQPHTTDADLAADADHATNDYLCANDESAGLDGIEPRRSAKPLREMTLIEALAARGPGQFSTIRPGALVGGRLLPGSVARRAALNATLVPIRHPGQAPPEPQYRPSTALANFVRCRDLTCRYPGCTVPATHCDVDHTIAWPCGPTQASNLKCLCRKHHLVKTFWPGWRDRQRPDGTVEFTDPDGRSHTTTPGSRLLFPELCEPSAPTIANGIPVAHATGLTMPRRTTTRAQDRARRIADERKRNQAAAEGEEREAKPPF